MPDRIPRVAQHVFIVSVAAAALFPLYYLLTNSLKGELNFAQNQWALPDTFQWSNYRQAWDAIAKPMVNTIVIVGATTLVTLLLASLSAFSFSIIRFPGYQVLYWLTLILLMIPSFLLLLPLYLQINRLPFRGGYLSIVLPSIAATQAFSIVVLKAFFDQIPRDLIDSAQIDGAGEFAVFRHIVAPLARPVLTSVAIIQVVALWNDYLLPQLVLDQKYRTVSVAMVAFTANPGQGTAPAYGALMAGYVLSAIPMVILFSFLMRAYIEGLTSGATKL